MTNVIKIKFLRDGSAQGREYTYFTPEVVEVGDVVDIRAGDSLSNLPPAQGIVTVVDVPMSEIEAFGDRAKSILGKAAEQPAKKESPLKSDDSKPTQISYATEETDVNTKKPERLYRLTNEFLDALERIELDEETGEILGGLELDEIEAKLEDKAESVACFIKDRRAFAETLKAEERALKERRERVEKKVDWLTDYLSNCLFAAGKDRVETPRALVSFRRSESVYIADESVLPEEYVTVKVERKPDKTLIKKALKSGEAVAGAELISKQNIQIK